MKLSEVQRAHELVGDGRKLVKAYVDVGCTKDIDAGNYGGPSAPGGSSATRLTR